jgi:uncharacterized protein YjbJ (UPF0337 family)
MLQRAAPGECVFHASREGSLNSPHERALNFALPRIVITAHGASMRQDKVEPETRMNKDIASGNFKQLKGKIKEQWGKLTDDEIDQMEGNAEILAGKLQERYGLAKDDAENQARDFKTRNNWQ